MPEQTSTRLGDEHLEAIRMCALDEVSAWSDAMAPQLKQIIEQQLAATGKRLRARLTLAFADGLGGDLTRAYAPGASAEMYHLAALILDDIEDNSAFRRGAPAVHTTTATSTAINVAATIRSLAYHPVHRSTRLSVPEKYAIHQRLDRAATHLVLGQSIDIGWHNDWYASPDEFPYDDMVTWKTGVLFEFGAWAGAFVAQGSPAMCDFAARFGLRAGTVYQMADDYLDLLAPAPGGDVTGEDLRDGKMTLAVRELVAALRTRGDHRLAREVVDCLSAANAGGVDTAWLQELFHTYEVADAVHRKVRAAVADLRDMSGAVDGRLRGHLNAFIYLLVPSAASAPTV
ncbi:MAG: hypothetical protein HOV78_13435 [Hamadaea sp.]|nr:hypothetical protein [Hamadaea sp.]